MKKTSFAAGFLFGLLFAFVFSRLQLASVSYEEKLGVLGSEKIEKRALAKAIEDQLGQNKKDSILRQDFLFRDLEKQANGEASNVELFAKAIIEEVREKEDVSIDFEPMILDEILEIYGESERGSEGEMIRKIQNVLKSRVEEKGSVGKAEGVSP